MAIRHYFRLAVVAGLGALGLIAAEHHGNVKFGGLPVPGVTITATQGDKKVVAVTDLGGAYAFPDLADGTWNMQAEMLAFGTLKQDVRVASDAMPTEWELKMLSFTEIGAKVEPASSTPAPASTTTAVATNAPAAAPAKPAKNAKNAPPPRANTPGAFQRTQANASSTAAPAPSGDAAPPTSDAFAGQSASDLSQRAADGFLINGTSNNGAASPFGISQAFGNNRRGPRSLYNGNVGLVLDNSSLDARAFSLTGQDTLKPYYNKMTLLGSYGGPMRLPHYRWRNPANFTVNYALTRNRNASTQTGLMPTDLERNGDFSQSVSPLGQPVQIFDPTTGLPFQGNRILDGRISPQAKALLALYPEPNFSSGSRYNYQIPIVGSTHQDSLQTRINKSIKQKNQLSGTFNFQRTALLNPNLFNFTDTSNIHGIDTGITWNRRFNSRFSTTLRYGYNRLSTHTTPNFANRQNISGQAQITGNNQDPLNWGPPSLQFTSGISGLFDGQQAFNRSQTSSISASGLYNRGRHYLSFGMDYRKLQSNVLSQQDARGSFTFTGATTQQIVNGAPVVGTGSDFAGFLLGVPDAASIAFGNADKYFRSSTYDVYFTDDWRINSGLTLNAGVRWEYGSPVTELFGRLVNLDVGPGFIADAPVIANHPVGSLTGQAYPDSLVHPDKGGFEPRIGLSWRPLPASSLVVRAGYGVYYNTSVYQSIATQMAQQSPLSKSLSVANTPSSPLTLANGFIATPGVNPNTFAIDPHFQVGYAQNWQVSVQRDLPQSLMMTVTYLGVKGTRGAQQFLPNTYPSGAVNPCPACPSGYAFMTSNGNSTREAGQFQIRRRLHSGFTASLQYTYAKAIDDAALGGGQGARLIAQNWLDLSAERGLSNFDQRHQINLTAQYTSGMGIGGGALVGGWRAALLKEWTIVTTVTAGTGLPLTPVYIAPVKGTGVTNSLRPNYTGVSVYDAPSGLNLNPLAYAAPLPGQWGNAGRNSITGPSQFQFNAQLQRSFRINDRSNVDLRVESTNLLNHVTYPNWNTTFNNAQFGLPTSANAMRSLQTTLRVRF